MDPVARASQAQLAAAVDALRGGALVAFPTETVYGLGADATSAVAVRKVFALKGRPANHPLIVHLADAPQLARWAREVTPQAHRLAEAFWPGPLTLVLPRAAGVLDVVTGGQDTVAVRVPSHPIARQLLQAFAGGIAAPSANRYGRVSATCAAHVREEFGDAVKVVLDGGECQVGLESTIVSCEPGRLRLLRPGAITLAELRRVAGEVRVGADAQSPRVPGSTVSHYAPRTPVTLVSDQELQALALGLSRAGERIAVLARRPLPPGLPGVTWIQAPASLEPFAHDLYANLRTLDKAGCARILVQQVPGDERWDAVRDRLARAAAPEVAADASVTSDALGALP
jgi:L-threonylcarbamoyladenylate synthase